MIVKIELLSDAIFGSGKSVPGAEDIAVKHDEYGFPLIGATNIKGNLRESFINLAVWKEMEESIVNELFGKADNDGYEGESGTQLEISDFSLPYQLRNTVCEEFEIKTEDDINEKSAEILNLFTNLRTFTKLQDGVAKNGSLRCARCINKGYAFYGEIKCSEKYENLVKEALLNIKWLGTMRSRGFGQVAVSVI